MKFSRLKKVAKSNDHDFDLQKAISGFKKKYKVEDKDLKNRNMSNPLYRQWTDYMWENYPIWSMSSVAYILRGWSYLVGGYPYGGVYWGYHDHQNKDDSNSSDSPSSPDIGGGDIGGGDM